MPDNEIKLNSVCLFIYMFIITALYADIFFFNLSGAVVINFLHQIVYFFIYFNGLLVFFRKVLIWLLLLLFYESLYKPK